MPRTSEPLPLLLDTHIWLWLVAGSSQLPAEARRAIGNALGVGMLRIAAISLWEIALLASRRRIVLGRPTNLWLDEALADPGPKIEPLTARIAVECHALPAGFTPIRRIG